MFVNFLKKLYLLLESVENFNKKINKYKSVTKEPSLPSYAYINWGLFLIEKGRIEEGIEKLNQSALMNESNPDIYVNLGIIYAQKGDFDTALKNFKKALQPSTIS